MPNQEFLLLNNDFIKFLILFVYAFYFLF
jgi:hypothetical protein